MRPRISIRGSVRPFVRQAVHPLVRPSVGPLHLVKNCVSQLLKIVKQLHKLSIKHGNLSLETVNARNRSKGLKIKLTGFDRATALK